MRKKRSAKELELFSLNFKEKLAGFLRKNIDVENHEDLKISNLAMSDWIGYSSSNDTLIKSIYLMVSTFMRMNYLGEEKNVKH